MKNETALNASVLTAENLDWFETARPQVTAFGLLNTFEDRAERNLYRAIEKALGAGKVAAPKKAPVGKGRRGVQPWTTAEFHSVIDAYLRFSNGGAVNKKAVVEAHRNAYPDRTEGAVSYVISHLRGLDVTVAAECKLKRGQDLVPVAYEVAPERFPAWNAA
jgi:hypothetical protein